MSFFRRKKYTKLGGDNIVIEPHITEKRLPKNSKNVRVAHVSDAVYIMESLAAEFELTIYTGETRILDEKMRIPFKNIGEVAVFRDVSKPSGDQEPLYVFCVTLVDTTTRELNGLSHKDATSMYNFVFKHIGIAPSKETAKETVKETVKETAKKVKRRKKVVAPQAPQSPPPPFPSLYPAISALRSGERSIQQPPPPLPSFPAVPTAQPARAQSLEPVATAPQMCLMDE